ncbi:Uncharacterised protein [Vibrio cholerae]|nr:Uncharacterised protein [Vibrio cholerae]
MCRQNGLTLPLVHHQSRLVTRHKVGYWVAITQSSH